MYVAIEYMITQVARQPVSFQTRHLSEITELTTHMSPRWGLGACVLSTFYKHVAPLGLKNLRFSQTGHIVLLPDKIGIRNNGTVGGKTPILRKPDGFLQLATWIMITQ